MKTFTETTHPIFTEDQTFIMGRKVQELKNGEDPFFLRIRECRRRFIKGKGDFYLDLYWSLRDQMADKITNEQGTELTVEFASRTFNGREDGIRRTTGQLDANGDMWLPLFRGFFPPEEFNVLVSIQDCLGGWQKKTYREGQVFPTGIDGIRKTWISDGTAAEWITSHNLPVAVFLPKLTASYKSRGRVNGVRGTKLC